MYYYDYTFEFTSINEVLDEWRILNNSLQSVITGEIPNLSQFGLNLIFNHRFGDFWIPSCSWAIGITWTFTSYKFKIARIVGDLIKENNSRWCYNDYDEFYLKSVSYRPLVLPVMNIKCSDIFIPLENEIIKEINLNPICLVNWSALYDSLEERDERCNLLRNIKIDCLRSIRLINTYFV